jgi:hypothetical protein
MMGQIGTSLLLPMIVTLSSCILKMGCFIFESVFSAPTGRRFII